MRCPFKWCTYPDCPCEKIQEILEEEEADAESTSKSIDRENAREINRERS